jgi:hypothetical protein
MNQIGFVDSEGFQNQGDLVCQPVGFQLTRNTFPLQFRHQLLGLLLLRVQFRQRCNWLVTTTELQQTKERSRFPAVVASFVDYERLATASEGGGGSGSENGGRKVGRGEKRPTTGCVVKLRAQIFVHGKMRRRN